jgi:hypothetical protein
VKQREYMKGLYRKFGDNKDLLIKLYAEAEQRGLVPRKSNTHAWTPSQYANALYRDGKRWGWISQT